jgi:hypothetical protein
MAGRGSSYHDTALVAYPSSVSPLCDINVFNAVEMHSRGVRSRHGSRRWSGILEAIASDIWDRPQNPASK